MGKKESLVQDLTKLTLNGMPGIRAFRNNVGAWRTPSGEFVKYGLIEGSSDLIGWVSQVITPDMVGRRVARFLAVECKAPGEREKPEQRQFRENVNAWGGISFVIDDPSHVKALIALHT